MKSENDIIPTHGVTRKRISQEQDYESDREVVHRAKAKLKRELKQAIEEHLKARSHEKM